MKFNGLMKVKFNEASQVNLIPDKIIEYIYIFESVIYTLYTHLPLL